MSAACDFPFHCVFPTKEPNFSEKSEKLQTSLFSQGRLFCYIANQKDYCVLEGKNILEEQDENKTPISEFRMYP